MNERDPRLKQCPKCDNWVGMSNVVGSCADCMNSKGFSVSCDCGIPGCAACWDGEEVAKVLEEEDYTAEEVQKLASLGIKVLSSGIKHCTQCNAQLHRLSIYDRCLDCAEKSETQVLEEAKINVIDPPPKTVTRYGWWISFLLVNKKDYTPILGNAVCFTNFSEIVEVDALNFLVGAAYVQSGESPQTYTATILNYKRMEGMDFEMKDFEDKENVLHVASGREPAEKENVVSMFGKDKS